MYGSLKLQPLSRLSWVQIRQIQRTTIALVIIISGQFMLWHWAYRCRWVTLSLRVIIHEKVGTALFPLSVERVAADNQQDERYHSNAGVDQVPYRLTQRVRCDTQVHLMTLLSLLAAVTAQVRLLKVIDPDGVVPPRAVVWEHFHAALFRKQEFYATISREVEQREVFPGSVGPRHHPEVGGCKVAWKERRRAQRRADCVRLTQL